MVIMLPYTSYDEVGTAYACLNGRTAPVGRVLSKTLSQHLGTLISGDAPCPTHGEGVQINLRPHYSG